MTQYEYLLQNVLDVSGLSGLGLGYSCDEDESNYPQPPALKQFQTGPVRSNKAKDDTSSRIKARLQATLKARIAEKEKGKEAKMSDYKSALPRTVSQAGSQSYEVEGDPRGAPIPDLDPLSPPPVPSPLSVQPMDVEMMSPTAGPMVGASDAPTTPACAPMPADCPFPVPQPQMMDPVTAQPQMDSVTAKGQMVDITDWTNQIHPGHIIQDAEIAHDNQNALTGPEDPMLGIVGFINTSGPEALQEDARVSELKERLEISCIEEDLKRSYTAAIMQQSRFAPAAQQPYDDYTSNGILPGEGSFLDDIMNAPQPPTEQGGQLDLTDKKRWGNGLGGGMVTPFGEAGEQFLFDNFGNRINNLPPLPSFNATFPQQIQKSPPTPPPLPVTVTVAHEGRKHVIPCTLETKIQTVMLKLKDMAGIQEEFFLSAPDMMPVNDQKILDRPGNYKFTVTVLPKPSKPQRRRPAKK